LACILGFALPYALVIAWDAVRWAIRPGYWRQSAMSYGSLSWASPAKWDDRLVEWLTWARYLTGSPILNALLLVGVALLIVRAWRRPSSQTRMDALFAAYGLAYLLGHAALQFSIWDRYLLPLAPLVALLLARTVVLTSRWLVEQVGALPQDRAIRVLIPTLVLLAAILAGGRAASNGYPVGGEHWAYQGLDQIAAYLRERAPPDAVLYHHWLRWHYTYYLHDVDLELRWWESGLHLRREAARTPDRAQYIVLPDWRTLEPDAEGVRLVPVYETRRRDGSISLRLYRIELESS
jgi:hypothetical protein